jgi:hypothetical protein
MLIDFFLFAGRSPSRQRLWRWLIVVHWAVLCLTLALLTSQRSNRVFSMLGYAHILLGIVEGSLVIGWRLVQWPKSQSLEPLLLANLSSRAVMAGEQAVGLAQLATLAASGIPLLVYAATCGWIDPVCVLLLPMQTFLWGSVVGFGLVVWAYESALVRRWGERITAVTMLVYFLLGGLVGEHTLGLLRTVPLIGNGLVDAIWAVHLNNPLALVHRMDHGDSAAGYRLLQVDGLALLGIGLLLARSAYRLEPHYVDRHYRPIDSQAKGNRGRIGDEPLSWWAVRRVHEYAGRVNLYLAGGAAGLYAAYLVAGDHWPGWMGNRIFLVFEQSGGVATFTTMLVILSAVPAAYQYGLWDSSKTDRCRRLETLLTTDLAPVDFERASWSASWSRGRGYFYSAVVLWLAAGISGRMDWLQVLTALAAGWLLLILYFVIGFRQLAVTGGGTTVGFLLCVVVPLAVWGLVRAGAAGFAQYLPPGMIYFAAAGPIAPTRAALTILLALAGGVWYLRLTLYRFDADIRRSFEADLLRAS